MNNFATCLLSTCNLLFLKKRYILNDYICISDQKASNIDVHCMLFWPAQNKEFRKSSAYTHGTDEGT